MATSKRTSRQPKDETETETAGAWAPPADVQELELSEFFNFASPGETVIGRVERTQSRPDPLHADRQMHALILSPAIAVTAAGKGEAYRSLAIGLSAHLQLLIGDARKEVGSCFAFVYDGTRPAQEKGKQASKQFRLYKLSEAQFVAQVQKYAGKHADTLLERGAPAAATKTDDDLPF